MTPARAHGGPELETPTQVLLRVGHDRNRRMLAEFLGDDVTIQGTIPEDPKSVDLVIVDDRVFSDVAAELEALVEAAAPVFLPIILLTGTDPDRLGPRVFERVDEIITIPINKRELELRLESVSHRRAASVALKAKQETSEARFRSLYEAVPDPIVAVTDDGVITEANEPFQRMVAAPSSELVGMNVSELEFEPDETVDRLLLGVGREDVDQDRVVSIGADSEDRILTELNVNALQNVGDVTERIGIFRDVTQRERFMMDLERQNERLDDFTSVVAHDLRNPLTIATGRVELARETGSMGHLERASEALEYMATLIEDLLDWSKQGDLVTDTASVDLADVARSAWEMTGEDTDCSLQVPARGTWVWADEDRLRQVFDNLFRNAIEHSDQPVTVTLSDMADGFAVEDDGSGFEDGTTDIFEPGFSSTDQGSGLGLATVSRIAEAHGWSVSATHGSDGGARFEFTGVRTDSPAD